MIKYDDFINESSDSRIIKSNTLINYLKEITGYSAEVNIENGNVEIYGTYNSPSWYNKEGDVAVAEYKKAFEIINTINEIAKMFKAKMSCGSDGGGSHSKFEILIGFENFDNMIDQDFMKSIKGLIKFKL